MKILFRWTQHYLSQLFLYNMYKREPELIHADDDENACYKSFMMIYAI